MLSTKKETIALAVLMLTVISPHISFARNLPKNGMKMDNQEIVFTTGKWREIRAKAKKNNQYIFVDAYATWCGPCKMLKSKTFKEKKAALYFNKNFINVSIDMESEEGMILAEKWSVTAYPTLLFFNPEGELVLQQLGFVNGKQLIDLGQQALMKK